MQIQYTLRLLLMHEMRYYSSNHNSPSVGLKDAILHSEAPDGGLFLPETIKKLPQAFFNNIAEMSPTEIAYFVGNTLFSPDIPSATIKRIGEQTFNFDMPMREIEPGIYAYELFHGPTGSVKDIGTRFLARLLSALHPGKPVNLLVATSGNAGSAITHGFYGVEGVNVYVFYPRNTPQSMAAQFVDLGGNIHAVRVNGTIDACRSIVATALADPKLNEQVNFTSANTVNIGRILPQVITYFQVYGKALALEPKMGPLRIGVPCGNAGNLFAGFMAKMMGCPIDKLIASCNANASMCRFLENGKLDSTTPTKRTLAYALDNSNPANIPRFLDVCHGNLDILRRSIIGAAYSDEAITNTIRDIYRRTGYLMGPHSAISYLAVRDNMAPGGTGIFLATAHPGRSADAVSDIIGARVELPHRLQCSYQKRLKEEMLPPTYPALRKYLLQSLGL